MKKKLATLLAAAVMTLSFAITSFAASFELQADSAYHYNNPLKGQNCEEVTIEYTIKWADNAAANGWDGIMSFYNSSTLGRVSIQTHPYVCWNSYNGNGWIDYKANTLCAVKGAENSFKIVINKDGIVVYKDGEVIDSGMTGSSASDAEPVEVSYQNILDAINEYDNFYIGVGSSQYAYWNTEICTLSNVKINGTEFNPDGVEKETTSLLGKPEKNTIDYGATVSDGSGAGISGVTITVIAVVAVAVVGIVVALVVIGKKKNKEADE